jgi:hypothetical protein
MLHLGNTLGKGPKRLGARQNKGLTPEVTKVMLSSDSVLERAGKMAVGAKEMQMTDTTKIPGTNSLQPVESPYSKEVTLMFEHFPKRDGYILKIFRVFANSTRFLKKGVVNLLDRESPLTMRLRELVILRVTANINCEYEWGVHVAAFGAYVDFGEAELHATQHCDHHADCWASVESLLVQVVDELCVSATLNDDLRQRFQETFSNEQQLEVLALCGNYHTVSFVANVSRIAPEDFAARFT